MYEDNKIVHENDIYKVVVGVFPEDKLESYLVLHKEHGVVEYCHSILHYAQAWADSYAQVLKGEKPGAPEAEELPDAGSVIVS